MPSKECEEWWNQRNLSWACCCSFKHFFLQRLVFWHLWHRQREIIQPWLQIMDEVFLGSSFCHHCWASILPRRHSKKKVDDAKPKRKKGLQWNDRLFPEGLQNRRNSRIVERILLKYPSRCWKLTLSYLIWWN